MNDRPKIMAVLCNNKRDGIIYCTSHQLHEVGCNTIYVSQPEHLHGISLDDSDTICITTAFQYNESREDILERLMMARGKTPKEAI